MVYFALSLLFFLNLSSFSLYDCYYCCCYITTSSNTIILKLLLSQATSFLTFQFSSRLSWGVENEWGPVWCLVAVWSQTFGGQLVQSLSSSRTIPRSASTYKHLSQIFAQYELVKWSTLSLLTCCFCRGMFFTKSDLLSLFLSSRRQELVDNAVPVRIRLNTLFVQWWGLAFLKEPVNSCHESCLKEAAICL